MTLVVITLHVWVNINEVIRMNHDNIVIIRKLKKAYFNKRTSWYKFFRFVCIKELNISLMNWSLSNLWNTNFCSIRFLVISLFSTWIWEKCLLYIFRYSINVFKRIFCNIAQLFWSDKKRIKLPALKDFRIWQLFGECVSMKCFIHNECMCLLLR